MPTFVNNLEDLTNVYVDCLSKTVIRMCMAMEGSNGITFNDVHDTVTFLDETVYLGQPSMAEFLDAKHSEEYIEKVTKAAFAKTALEHIVDDKNKDPLIRFMACALITTNTPNDTHQTQQTSKLLTCVERLGKNKRWQDNKEVAHYFTNCLARIEYDRANRTETPRQIALGKAADKIRAING